MELVGHSVLKGNRVPQLIFATLFRSTGLSEIHLGAKLSGHGVAVLSVILNNYLLFTGGIGQFFYLSHK